MVMYSILYPKFIFNCVYTDFDSFLTLFTPLYLFFKLCTQQLWKISDIIHFPLFTSLYSHPLYSAYDSLNSSNFSLIVISKSSLRCKNLKGGGMKKGGNNFKATQQRVISHTYTVINKTTVLTSIAIKKKIIIISEQIRVI